MVSFTDWLTPEQARKRICEQAEAIAFALGHVLTTPWVHTVANEYLARCINCNETAVVRPRSLHKAPMSGEAVTFRCGGDPRPVAPKPPPKPAPPPHPFWGLYGRKTP